MKKNKNFNARPKKQLFDIDNIDIKEHFFGENCNTKEIF
jgi:hypothetical protein